MKTKIIAVAGLAFFAANTASAIDRIQTAGRSCSEVQSIIRANRAVIVQYPASQRGAGLLYDRAVSDRDMCLGSGFGERSYIPARDTSRCGIWICRPSTDLRP